MCLSKWVGCISSYRSFFVRMNLFFVLNIFSFPFILFQFCRYADTFSLPWKFVVFLWTLISSVYSMGDYDRHVWSKLSWSRWQSANWVLLQWFLDAHSTSAPPPTLSLLWFPGAVRGRVWPRAAPRGWGRGREVERGTTRNKGGTNGAATTVSAATTTAQRRGCSTTAAA